MGPQYQFLRDCETKSPLLLSGSSWDTTEKLKNQFIQLREHPILKLPFACVGLEAATQLVIQSALDRSGGYGCLVNVHSLTESLSHPSLRGALESARFRFADGMPIVWLLKHHGRPVASRVGGPDLMHAILSLNSLLTQGFLGGSPSANQTIVAKYGLDSPQSPQTPVVNYSPPYRPFSAQNAIEDWSHFLKLCPNGEAPQLVWVGLGCPKQELWMQVISPRAPRTLFLGVGAAFDFLSGKIDRAPSWMQRSGLEWLHRLSQDPKRLATRYLKTNVRFLWEARKELIRSAKN